MTPRLAFPELVFLRAPVRPWKSRLDISNGCETILAMESPRIPRRGERVRVDGHPGTLIVVRVDRVNQVAGVESWNDPRIALWDIPFAAIHRIHQTVLEAA